MFSRDSLVTLSCFFLGCFPRLQLVLQRSTATSNKKTQKVLRFKAKAFLFPKKQLFSDFFSEERPERPGKLL